jgi:hypothetical protein
MEIQKEEIENLHQIALDRINRFEKTVYTIALISFFCLKDGVKLKLLIMKKSLVKP